MSEDVDFGDAGDLTAITLEKQRLAAEMARVRFDKNFQLSILTILIISVALLLAYDFVVTIYEGASHFQTVLTVIMPVFTFLLGMGTQTGESNKP